MLNTVVSLLAIAYLPGAIIFRLPIAERSRRAALPAEERLFWAVIISIIITTTAAFVLAAMSAFSLRAVVWCDVALAARLALASLGNLRLGPAAPWPTWTAALPAVLIAAGASMYFAAPAAEYVLGGRDPGVYMNEGIQIAQRQSLVTTDRVAAAVPVPSRDLFFPSHADPNYLQSPLHGISSARSRSRHSDRPVPARISDLDCHRVRIGWRHGTRARHCVVGDSGRSRRCTSQEAG